MKILTGIKLLILGALIVALGHWLRGHDVLTGIVLVSTVVLLALKFYFHFFHFRQGPSGSSGGTFEVGKPVPVPPVRPAPRKMSAVRPE